ncbi:hypothetical protein U1Q18_038006 [Sarracenia purpurea var. burkii]
MDKLYIDRKEFVSLIVIIHDHRLVFSAKDIVLMYHLPRVHAPQYSFAESVSPSCSKVSRELTNGAFSNMVTLKPHHLAPHYRLLHRITTFVVEPTGYLSDMSATRADLLYAFGRCYSIDLAHRMWSGIMSYSRHAPGIVGIPYASHISMFCIFQFVQVINSEPTLHSPTDISWESLSRSAACVHLDASDILTAECIQPCPSPIEPTFPTIHPIAEKPIHVVSSSFSYGAATPILQEQQADVPIAPTDNAESPNLDDIPTAQPEEDIPSADILR